MSFIQPNQSVPLPAAFPAALKNAIANKTPISAALDLDGVREDFVKWADQNYSTVRDSPLLEGIYSDVTKTSSDALLTSCIGRMSRLALSYISPCRSFVRALNAWVDHPDKWTDVGAQMKVEMGGRSLFETSTFKKVKSLGTILKAYYDAGLLPVDKFRELLYLSIGDVFEGEVTLLSNLPTSQAILPFIPKEHLVDFLQIAKHKANLFLDPLTYTGYMVNLLPTLDLLPDKEFVSLLKVQVNSRKSTLLHIPEMLKILMPRVNRLPLKQWFEVFSTKDAVCNTPLTSRECIAIVRTYNHFLGPALKEIPLGELLALLKVRDPNGGSPLESPLIRELVTPLMEAASRVELIEAFKTPDEEGKTPLQDKKLRKYLLPFLRAKGKLSKEDLIKLIKIPDRVGNSPYCSNPFLKHLTPKLLEGLPKSELFNLLENEGVWWKRNSSDEQFEFPDTVAFVHTLPEAVRIEILKIKTVEVQKKGAEWTVTPLCQALILKEMLPFLETLSGEQLFEIYSDTTIKLGGPLLTLGTLHLFKSKETSAAIIINALMDLLINRIGENKFIELLNQKMLGGPIFALIKSDAANPFKTRIMEFLVARPQQLMELLRTPYANGNFPLSYPAIFRNLWPFLKELPLELRVELASMSGAVVSPIAFQEGILKLILENTPKEEHAAFLKIQDNMGQTVLHRMLEPLIQTNVPGLFPILRDLSNESKLELLQVRDKKGKTPLDNPKNKDALINELCPDFRGLLEAAKRPNAEGRTALHDPAMLKFLVQMSLEPFFERQGGFMVETSLLSTFLTKENLAQLLQISDRNGNTPLITLKLEKVLTPALIGKLTTEQLALLIVSGGVWWKDEQLAALFLEHFKDNLIEVLKIQDADGKTAWHSSEVGEKIDEILEQKLGPQADHAQDVAAYGDILKVQDCLGKTPLHYLKGFTILRFLPQEQLVEILTKQTIMSKDSVLHNLIKNYLNSRASSYELNEWFREAIPFSMPNELMMKILKVQNACGETILHLRNADNIEEEEIENRLLKLSEEELIALLSLPDNKGNLPFHTNIKLLALVVNKNLLPEAELMKLLKVQNEEGYCALHVQEVLRYMKRSTSSLSIFNLLNRKDEMGETLSFYLWKTNPSGFLFAIEMVNSSGIAQHLNSIRLEALSKGLEYEELSKTTQPSKTWLEKPKSIAREAIPMDEYDNRAKEVAKQVTDLFETLSFDEGLVEGKSKVSPIYLGQYTYKQVKDALGVMLEKIKVKEIWTGTPKAEEGPVKLNQHYSILVLDLEELLNELELLNDPEMTASQFVSIAATEIQNRCSSAYQVEISQKKGAAKKHRIEIEKKLAGEASEAEESKAEELTFPLLVALRAEEALKHAVQLLMMHKDHLGNSHDEAQFSYAVGLADAPDAYAEDYLPVWKAREEMSKAWRSSHMMLFRESLEEIKDEVSFYFQEQTPKTFEIFTPAVKLEIAEGEKSILRRLRENLKDLSDRDKVENFMKSTACAGIRIVSMEGLPLSITSKIGNSGSTDEQELRKLCDPGKTLQERKTLTSALKKIVERNEAIAAFAKALRVMNPDLPDAIVGDLIKAKEQFDKEMSQLASSEKITYNPGTHGTVSLAMEDIRRTVYANTFKDAEGKIAKIGLIPLLKLAGVIEEKT